MGEMPMPGGWTMSMMWMRMPGQTWPGAAAAFLASWIVMTAAMMLPVLVPALRRYRGAVGAAAGARLGWSTAIVGAGYFVVWSAFGLAVYPLGAGVAALAMREPSLSRAVPAAIGVIVLIAGAVQFTAWKVRQVRCCEDLPAHADGAWRLGLRLGRQCVRCCANLMAILLVAGVMDLGAMAAVTAAIVIERVAPGGRRGARAVGFAAIAAAVLFLARAAAHE